MLKKLCMLAVVCAISTISHATISPSQADYFLLKSPPPTLSSKVPAHYGAIEKLTGTMFSTDATVRHGQGYRDYLTVKNQADMRNPYAAYNTGLYQIINRERFNFKYSESLLYLKLGADGGVHDSMYALALIYLNNTDEVVQVINRRSKFEGLQNNNESYENKIKLLALGQQYVLYLAQLGHERAFMTACNFYTSGQYLQRDIVKVALCYNNAIKTFDSDIAKGLLAKLYFESTEFRQPEFEVKGIQLAMEAVEKGNQLAVYILGKQLLQPNFPQNMKKETGLTVLRSATAQGDEKAAKLLADYLKQ